MNPDSSSPENNAPLPEVPSILPPPLPPIIEPEVMESEDTLLVAEPVPTVPPEITAATPPAAQPPVRPVAFASSGIVSDIRRPQPVAQSQPAPQAPSSPFSAAPQTAPSLAVPKKKSKLLLIIGLVVGGLALMGGIAAVLLLFVFGANGKVADSDLVSATTDGTTYLRPKQWQPITTGDVSGYGNLLGKNNKSTGLIAAMKGAYVGVLDNPTDAQLSEVRDAAVKVITPSYLETLNKNDGGCNSASNLKTAASTVKNARSYGIIKITANCVQDDGSNSIVIDYMLLGNDGYARMITLRAAEANWKQNEAVYNKMIDSADQQ